MPSVMKVCVCEPFELRTRSGGEPFIHGIVLESGASDLVHVYCNNVQSDVARDLLSLELRMKVIFAKALVRTGSISMVANSRVIRRTANFEVDSDKVEAFIRPVIVSLAVAATSPKSQRLSVRGTVSEIGTLVSTPSYTRRRLVLTDNNLDGQVAITMWGNPAREILASVNDTILVTAVEVNSSRELNATKLSCVEVEEAVTIGGVVVGTSAMEDGYPMDVVLENGDVFQMPEDICNALISSDLPTNVSYRLVDGVIAEMRILGDL